jgi:hypothetical protein
MLVDGLGEITVHAGRQAPFLISPHGMRRHRHDPRMLAALGFALADDCGSFCVVTRESD